MQYVDVSFELKALDEDGRVQGHGSVFGNTDLGLDRVEPGAFKASLRARRGRPMPMLWQHDPTDPIGVWDKFQEDKTGLFVEGQLNLSRKSGLADVPTAFKARALAEQGAVRGLSIGFFAEKFSFDDEVRVIEKADVVEVSLVTFPMNPEAEITAVKNLTNKEFVRELRRRMGLSREAAEALRAGGFKALREYVGVSSREAGDTLDRLRSVRELVEDLTP